MEAGVEVLCSVPWGFGFGFGFLEKTVPASTLLVVRNT